MPRDVVLATSLLPKAQSMVKGPTLYGSILIHIALPVTFLQPPSQRSILPTVQYTRPGKQATQPTLQTSKMSTQDIRGLREQILGEVS